jgi:hypothetical protein
MLYALEKKKSHHRIEIVEDLQMDEDGWFLEVRWIKKKTDKIEKTSCIIRKDLEDWLSGFKSDGWYLISTQVI